MPSAASPWEIDKLGALYDAAAEMFIARGIAGFSIQDLARQIGIGPLEPYRWFEDKWAILAAVQTRAFAKLTRVLEKAAAENRGLGDSSTPYRAYLEHASQNAADYRLMFEFVLPGETDYPELVAARTRACETIQKFFKLPFLNAQVQGDLDLVSRASWVSLHGAVMLALTGHFSGNSLERIAEETWSAFVKALQCQKQQANLRAPVPDPSWG